MHHLPDRITGPAGPTEPVVAPDRARRARRRCWLDMTLIGLSLFVYMLAAELLTALVFRLLYAAWPALFANLWALQVINWVCTGVACPALMLLLLRWVSTRDLPGRQTGEMNPGRMLRYCAAAYGCAIATNFVTLMITGFMARQGSEVTNVLDEAMDAATSMPMLALSLVLIAPLVEEVIFRHLLLRRLRKYGDGFCMAATALAFSLSHANIPQMLYAFTLGLLLAYVVLRYGHIIYSILMHAFVNFMGFLAYGFDRVGGERSYGLFSGYAMLLALVGFVLLLRGLRRVRLSATALPLSLRFRWFALLCNPGNLLFVAITVFYISILNFG